MGRQDDIFGHFSASFEDFLMSRQERRDLRRLLTEEGLDAHELSVLRSRIFDFAEQQFAKHDPIVVSRWIEGAMKTIIAVSATQQDPPSAYFSPGTDILFALRDLMGEAQNRLLICVFTISDDRLSKAIKTAHQRGIDVRIITDNHKSEDKGSDIEYLHKSRVPVRMDRSPDHMHHKYAIVDDHSLVTGSYNWTRSAETRNQENIVVLHDASLIRQFEKEFERLWDRCEPY